MLQSKLTYKMLQTSLIDTFKLPSADSIRIYTKYGQLKAVFCKDDRKMCATYRKGWVLQ